MHQSLQGATFHVEHILPRSRGGPTTPENLALACPACNLHKADRTHWNDTPLYDPRSRHWAEHFAWVGTRIFGLTAIGQATIAMLDLNSETRLLIREAESLFGLFPPTDD